MDLSVPTVPVLMGIVALIINSKGRQIGALFYLFNQLQILYFYWGCIYRKKIITIIYFMTTDVP